MVRNPGNLDLFFVEEQRPYSRCRLGGHGLSRADGFLPGFVIPSEENRPG
jgi:hypothetical protein